MSEESTLTLKQFLLRFWIWHFSVTTVFFVLVVLIIRPDVATIRVTNTDLLVLLCCLLLSIVHSILILIFSMRRFSRKEIRPGFIYILHFIFSSSLAYYTGFLFSGAVLADLING